MNDAELLSFCNEMIGKFKMLSDLQKEMQYELIDTKFTEWELKKLIFALDVLRTIADRPQGWIPCSERLPEEGEIVLVCVRLKTFKYDWEEQRGIEFGRINSDRYDFNGTGWEWLNESGADYWQADYNNSIIAWMPLPEPYSGKG